LRDASEFRKLFADHPHLNPVALVFRHPHHLFADRVPR
jgi:hypothetical protein